jgi:ATP-dependent Clp endopeptidase proteolytic subunit ClpP
MNIRKNIYEDGPSKKPSKKENLIDPKMESIFDEIDYGIDIRNSIIYLHGDIQLGNLFDIIAKCRLLLRERPKETANDPINLLINTNGGDVYEALGIIDFMASLSVPVNVIARGRAMSAGAMILCCGTGIRAASKNTTIMIHEASAEIYGKTADIKANADHIDQLEEDFYKIMAQRTKQDEVFWRKACRKDFYMSAEKALEYGIIDQIIE